MARPKEFDENEVLDRALLLFRRRGYQPTSFANLTGDLGISRQSLYDTFGDKQTLYRLALRRYLDRTLAFVGARLEEPGPVREVLIRLFDSLIDYHCQNDGAGCFIVNSMIELAPSDAAVRRIATAHAREFQARLAARLEAAQAAGELARAPAAAALAALLYHTLLGLAVAARALGDQPSLHATARLAVNSLP